jgi:hypothetical protein
VINDIDRLYATALWEHVPQPNQVSCDILSDKCLKKKRISPHLLVTTKQSAHLNCE